MGYKSAQNFNQLFSVSLNNFNHQGLKVKSVMQFD